MWFDPHSISKTLSLTIVTKHYSMPFETMWLFFTVHLQDQEIRSKRCDIGMYYYNTAAAEDFGGDILTSISDSTPDGTGEKCLLNMVAEKSSWFKPHQFIRDKPARCIYAMMGRPSRKDFQNMVHRHTIKTVCSPSTILPSLTSFLVWTLAR